MSSTCAVSTVTSGCLVVVRPDQYVAHVLPLDATEELVAFFAGILTGAAQPDQPGAGVQKNKGAGALKIVHPG